MVVNKITVRSRAMFNAVATKISVALKRPAEHEAKEIKVSVNNDTVTLRGRVASFAEKDIARRAAWSVPAVRNVVDVLCVGGQAIGGPTRSKRSGGVRHA